MGYIFTFLVIIGLIIFIGWLPDSGLLLPHVILASTDYNQVITMSAEKSLQLWRLASYVVNFFLVIIGLLIFQDMREDFGKF